MTALTWSSLARVTRTGAVGPLQQVGDHGGTVLGRLARPVDRLGQAEPQVAVVVDPGEPQIGVGEAPEPAHGVVGRAASRGDVVDECSERGGIHDLLYPAQL